MNYDPNQQYAQQGYYGQPQQQQYTQTTYAQQQYYEPPQQYVQTTTTTYAQPQIVVAQPQVVVTQPVSIAPIVTTFTVDPMYVRARSLLSIGSLLFFFGAILCIFVITSPIGLFLGFFGFIINIYNFIVHSKYPVARGPATSSLVLAIIEGVFCAIYTIIAIIVIIGAAVGGSRG